jgi:hypothetical protein
MVTLDGLLELVVELEQPFVKRMAAVSAAKMKEDAKDIR